jgi:hypothetical protein
MRDLKRVIDQMLACIPHGYTLTKDLEKMKIDINFTAPEMMGNRWQQVNEILHDAIGLPIFDWQSNVIKIWMNKDERAKLIIRYKEIPKDAECCVCNAPASGIAYDRSAGKLVFVCDNNDCGDSVADHSATEYKVSCPNCNCRFGVG